MRVVRVVRNNSQKASAAAATKKKMIMKKLKKLKIPRRLKVIIRNHHSNKISYLEELKKLS
jgi:hypothetical protein